MKVANTRRINEHIMQFVEREQLNHLIGISVSVPASEQIVFNDYTGLKRYADTFQQSMTEDGINYTDDESIIAVMVSSIAAKTLDISDGQQPLPTVILNDIIKGGRVFHRGVFENNLYLRNIHFAHQKLGRFKLVLDSYAKYEVIHYSVPANKYNGVMIPRIGTFDHRFKYPSIKENNYTWMSVTPNEILTMEKPIADAKGNVLTVGCGLGYYAYMISEKENVEHVTIIEKEPEVIELFNTFILPQFAHKDKIIVIQVDAFDYMENLKDGEFDYCFADIWISNHDIVPYMKLKKICKKFKKMSISYWIEDTLIDTIMKYIYIIIVEEFYKNNDIQYSEFTKISKDEEYKKQYLKDLLENVEITKAEHIDYYMDYKNIINLMS
ncbi:class I SAM-dependent methyltransferase [Lachnospiraceae bacterium 48-33]